MVLGSDVLTRNRVGTRSVLDLAVVAFVYDSFGQNDGRAVTHVGRHWLPTTETEARSQVISCRGEPSGTGAGFILPTAPHPSSSSSTGVGRALPAVACVPGEISLTPTCERT
jgi:hypothetical protein